MVTKTSYRRIVIAGAWYDLLAAIGFATPWTFTVVYQALIALNRVGGFSRTMPIFEPMHVLMANMFGTAVVIWAVLRLRDPQSKFGRYNAAIRLFLICWQLYAVMQGGSQIILGISAALLLFAIAESLPMQVAASETGLTPSMRAKA